MTKQPRLALTSGRDVVLAALAGALLGFIGMNLFTLFNSYPPVVPWSLPGILVALGVGVLTYARRLPSRLEERRVSAREAVIALVVAKSMISTGAILAGAHAVYVGRSLLHVAAQAPLARTVRGLVTIVVCGAFAWVGWYLERLCVAGDDDEEGGAGAPAADPA
ncbi:DUF3180 domain-containing protein [Arachnia propionica]|uniref:DUF3180 domain-containing protein n=1 Tax=Arachnia propionica TaxID=1750 RepID=A0A3P1WT62_9ACTN|nr:DUF3180 domain-containing protein [Arachnia propionica]RRD48967.1 DUF3180 domain-containing protein [Arachnia propionica]